MADLSTEIVDAINAGQGRHPGFRAVHAKGIVASGTFTPSGLAAPLTTAAHLQAAPVPVTVRFSNGGGNPKAHDGARDGRGMAVKFQLADGSNTDIVAISLPAFFVRTPEDFLEFTRVRLPDPATGVPDQAKIGAFVAAHPETQIALGAAMSTPPTPSYAVVTYRGLHGFRFVNAAGEGCFVRYTWRPDATQPPLTDDEAKAKVADFLQQELRDRFAIGPIGYALELQLAQPGDDPDDPTRPWPEDRETLIAGRLSLTAEVTDPAKGEHLIWDPTNVTPGIECSSDQVLHARSGAYSVSYARRQG